MTNEYKIIKEKNQTRFVLETTSAGGGVAVTGGGSIAAAVSPMGRVHKRSQEESEQIKTRNPGVPALGKKTGGGAHRDRKKEMKQGKEKHKKPFAEDFKEPDHEISMAKNELRMIYKSALELFQLIKQYSEMEGLEAWQQSKITKAADYLHSVLQSLSGDRADKGLDEQGVAEGLEDSNIQSVIIDTVERLFRRNNIGDYDSLEAVRQGVKHHFSKPGANVDSAIEGILNILSRRMRKQGNYNDLSRFKDALSQGIRHQLKKQGVTEGLNDPNIQMEAEYQGRKVSLGKPFLTPDGPKKRSVYVRKPNGRVVKVNFGDKKMKIKKSNPQRRKSFRARHRCANPGPRTSARYWSCKFW